MRINYLVIKRLSLVFISCAAILLLIYLYNYLQKGTLIVNYDSDSSKLIIKNSGAIEIISTESNSLTTKIDSGKYVVEAIEDDGGVVSGFASVEKRKTTTINLISGKLLPERKIKSIPTSYIERIDSGLIVVEANSKIIKSIDKNNANLSSSLAFLTGVENFSLDNSGNGFAKTEKNLLYKISKGSFSNIRDTVLSSVDTLGTPRDIKYSASNRKLIISAGDRIYSSNLKEPAKEIFKAPWEIRRMGYNGGNWISLVEEPPQESRNEYGEPDVVTYSLSLLNTTDNTFYEVGKSDAYKSEDISPDSKYLAYYQNDSLVIHNISNRNTVNKLPIRIGPNIRISWCDRDRVVFSDIDGIWSYSVGSEQKHKINKSSDVTALNCYNNEVYVGTFRYPNSGKTFKLVFNDQVAQLVKNLNLSLPYNGKSIVVDYSFIDKNPVVNVRILLPKNLYGLRKGDVGYLSAEIFKEQAKKEARQYLKDNGINLNEVKIVYELG